ncbi:Uncharacterised protein [Burkholderia pseudomallei]|nr:hypothetical protein BBU_5256 [Burkholderia pseudomallei NAU35A-3]KGS36911.1 hypothetical protein X945_5486 [Burkholderia pseudomallei ABCPW 107]VBM35500.1 Uncharacterised protein [Burkholderia pseudomallei]
MPAANAAAASPAKPGASASATSDATMPAYIAPTTRDAPSRSLSIPMPSAPSPPPTLKPICTAPTAARPSPRAAISDGSQFSRKYRTISVQK